MKKVTCLLFAGITFLLVACTSQESYARTEILMGTTAEVRLTTGGSQALLDEAFELLHDLERRLTVNEAGSEIEDINEAAGIAPVFVSEDTFYLIERALYFTVYSEGLFNAAIGPLTRLWNINFEGERRPDDEEIFAILPLLNWEAVTVDREAQTVFLEEVGMRLDLGAIAKGFMADEVAQLLQENGVENGLIILGGEVVAIGTRSDGYPWNIAILDPNDRSYLIGTIPASNQAVVSSGTYERYIEGTAYHHIFDSRTGFPFDNEVVHISVLADTALLGEVYTTIAFGKGLDDGLAYIESLENVEALFISAEGGLYLTSGLKDTFHLMSDDFEVGSRQ